MNRSQKNKLLQSYLPNKCASLFDSFEVPPFPRCHKVLGHATENISRKFYFYILYFLFCMCCKQIIVVVGSGMCILRFYYTFINIRKESWSTKNFLYRVTNQKLLIFLRLLLYNSAFVVRNFCYRNKKKFRKIISLPSNSAFYCGTRGSDITYFRNIFSIH